MTLTAPARNPDLTPILPPTRFPTWVGAPGARDRMEAWFAISTDLLWLYERIDGQPGTPWEITHVPTLATLHETSLPKARRWTAAGAIEAIRHQALEVVERNGEATAVDPLAFRLSPEQRADAARRGAAAARRRVVRAAAVVAILDGTMLPAGHEHTAPQAGCAGCGGRLRKDRRWRHVDACATCWTPAGGWTRRYGRVALPYCRDDRAAHVLCDRPLPVLCPHPSCRAPATLVNYCPFGSEPCCGCCGCGFVDGQM